METLDLRLTPWRHVRREDLKRAANAGGGDDPAWDLIVDALRVPEAISLVLLFGGQRIYVQSLAQLEAGRITTHGRQVAATLGLPVWRRIVKALGGSGSEIYVPVPKAVFQATAARLLDEGWPEVQVRTAFGFSAAEMASAVRRFGRAQPVAEG